MIALKARRLLSVFVAVFLIATMAPPASALESFGIGALPANPRADNPRTKSIFVYEAQPGKTIVDAVKVINNSSGPKTLSIYPVDSQLSSDGAFACAQAADTPSGVGKWLKLAKEKVTLQPGTNETVSFTMTVPRGAEVGEHNGCIAIQDLTTQQKDARGIVLNFRSALRVAVVVPGKTKASLKIVDVKERELPQQKLQISPVLRNDGNVSLDANLQVKLVNVLGLQATASKGQLPVLPRTDAQYNFELTTPFWGGWYNRIIEVDYKQLMQNGSAAKDTHLVASSKWLYVAPHPIALMIIVGLILLLIAGGVYLIRNRRRHALIDASKKHYRVQEGDNIQAVAEKFGQDWKLLIKLNRLKPPYTLRPGQILAIPQLTKDRPEKANPKRVR